MALERPSVRGICFSLDRDVTVEVIKLAFTLALGFVAPVVRRQALPPAAWRVCTCARGCRSPEWPRTGDAGE